MLSDAREDRRAPSAKNAPQFEAGKMATVDGVIDLALAMRVVAEHELADFVSASHQVIGEPGRGSELHYCNLHEN
jgi:hypothetical protein